LPFKGTEGDLTFVIPLSHFTKMLLIKKEMTAIG
jgi:hypothetical protein